VVIHSNLYKRGKMKWNQRYSVLIKPLAAEGKASIFYFKNSKQFMKQQKSWGQSVLDVARLFDPPAPGKEVC
jgi:hypothetical protein